MGFGNNDNVCDKAMVAYCDLLGFSSFVKSNTLKEAVNFLLKMKEGLKVYFKNYVSCQHGDDKVGIVSISDSVIIYSLKDNEASHLKVIIAAYALLAKTIKYPQYRWRIGISHGDFFHDESKHIYVGKALIEAQELEKKQDWCGGILSETAAKKALAISAIKTEDIIMQYDVPIKNSPPESYHVINWTRASHNWNNNISDVLPREFPASMTKNERADVERKLKNTEVFHNKICVCCRTQARGEK